ncbi:MAG: substrate-binding domain-containing protein [Deltaproteobacteria bacterium]|jgi:AI-2 transport system substrate-binding protein|nr:substrate-binding domain-containing protein [Deltaproteobacteria bacterium]
MTRLQGIAPATAAAALAFLLAACGGETGTDQLPREMTVVFVPKITGNAFFEAANRGAQEFAERNGFKVSYMGSPNAQLADQTEVLERAIESSPDAISVSSLDATALDGILKRARDKGISVTTWDSDVSGDARSIMVSQGTPAQLGRMLVEMSAKGLEKRGRNPATDAIKYVWHYSRPEVTDQNSWRAFGEEYIKSAFPNWVNLRPENYYSGQDPEKALAVGIEIMESHPDIDLVICNDSTSLPGQAEAMKTLGKGANDLTVTGFASPNAMREYAKIGVVDRWGLWDVKLQGALACYISFYLASGNGLVVGQMVDVPEIGLIEVMPNTVLDPAAYTANDSGVVLLPRRTEFTAENVDDYDF